MDRDRLQQFHRERFAPGGLSVVVVGDVMTEHAAEVVTEAFGSWEPREDDVRPPESPVRATTRRRVVVPMMNKSQSDIGYGFTTVSRADPTYYAHWLMSNIFGQYGMGGRLGQSIRERQGMAYYAFCVFEAGVVAGPLIVRAGVSGDNVDRAVASIDTEVASLAADGVTDDELSNSQRYLTGSLPRQLETNAGIAAFLQEVQQFDLGLDYDLRVRDLIERVTRDQVNEAARLTLAPERAAVAIAGPYQDSAA
jgi:zinc protease